MAKLKSERKPSDRIFWLVIVLCLLAEGLAFYGLSRNDRRIVVYELTWQAKDKDGKAVFNRWRYFLKYPACLPVRIEKYVQSEGNEQYHLTETLLIDYPKKLNIEM